MTRRPVRVGIDHLPAVTHTPGVGRYVRELVAALSGLDDRPELALYEVGLGRRIHDSSALARVPGVERYSAHVSRRVGRWRHRLEGWGADRAVGGVDLFHQSWPHLVPVARAPRVVALSELPDPSSRQGHRLAVGLTSAAGVFVFSSAAAERVEQEYGRRAVIVPVGCDHWSRVPTPAASCGDVPRVLMLGALAASRHPRTVLSACEVLARRGLECELHLAGGHGDEADAFMAAATRTSVLVVRHRPDERHMPELMACASVLVHLSDDELTPVTPLEAFASGRPVVASRLPAFVEALGGQAQLVETGAVVDDPACLADALAAALGEAGGADRVAERKAVAARYTWDAAARATVAAWRQVLGLSA